MNNISKLIDSFRKFPSVGPKQAERFVMYILRANIKEIDELVSNIIETKNNIRECKMCNNYSLNEICDICQDDKREKNTICIVENPFDIIAIEKTKSYNGLYYVIGSYIIPHNEENNFKSKIDKLVEMVKNGNIQEVIIALNTTTEGQATALHIKQILQSYVSKISRIAFGIPLGADIDYMDEYTLSYALKRRTLIDE